VQVKNVPVFCFAYYQKLIGTFCPFEKLYLFNSANNKPESQDSFFWYFFQISLWVLEYLHALHHPTFSLARPQELDTVVIRQTVP